MADVGGRRRSRHFCWALLVLVSSGLVVATPPASGDELRGYLTIDPRPAIAGEHLTLKGGLGPFQRTIVLQRRVSGEWVKVVQKTSTKDGDIKLTLKAPGKTTSYRLYGDAFTVNGHRKPAAYSPSVTVKILGQTASLDPIANAAVGDTRRAYVAFNPARKGRKVELQQSVGGIWKVVATSAQSALGKTSLAVNTSSAGTFTYRAVTVAADGAPAQATSTRTVVVTAPDLAPPPVPANLTTTSGERSIGVAWSPVSAPDLAGYRLLVATSLDGNYYPATSELMTATSHVAFAQNGTSLWFKVASVDLSGNESAYAGPVQGTARDQTAPPVPTGLAVTPGNAHVLLTWNAVVAADLSGYRVLMSATGSDPWVEVTSSPITALQYDATGLTNESTYYFAVVAEDTTGNQSARTPAVPATPSAIDSVPPPVPTGVTATAADSAVDVAWSAVTAGDLAGYRVYYGPSDTGPWTQATSGPVTQLTYRVTGLQNGTTYWFAVSSADTAGNVSAKSSPASATPGDQGEWASLAAGYGHTCGVKNDDTLWCWGNNGSGQLGTGAVSEDGEALPVQVGSDRDWAQVDAGDVFTCAIKTDATLWCFGGGSSGQLGLGPVTSQLTPAQVSVGATWKTVALGAAHACGVRTDGTLWCWGANSFYQVGDGSDAPRDVPVKIGSATTWSTVDAGRTHSCATRSAGTGGWCWGSNGSSELGNATADPGQTPTALTETGWTRLLPGNQYSCGLRTDGSLWCWGIPYSGQTGGNGSFGTKAAVTPPSTWSSATTGGEHGCGIRLTGALWCWGRSDFGQVGHGVPELNVPPTVIASGSQWRSVSAGVMHTCGVRQDGTAWCWGANGSGELGVGNTDNLSVPTQVGTPTP